MADEAVLITGYPGLVARRMMAHVLTAEADTRVILVVLDKLMPTAEEALSQLSDAHRTRVEVLEGDAAAIDMGLSGAEKKLPAFLSGFHHKGREDVRWFSPCLSDSVVQCLTTKGSRRHQGKPKRKVFSASS